MDYTTIANVQASIGQIFNGTTTPNNTEVSGFITEASAQVDAITGQVWGTVQVNDEYVDFNRFTADSTTQTGYIGGNILPDGMSIGRYDTSTHYFNSFKTEKRPIISVGTLLCNSGLPTSTYDVNLIEGTDFITYLDEGKIVLIQNIPNLGLRRFKMSYVAGQTPVPSTVQRLCTLITVKQILSSKIAASNFGSVDSISIEGISITKSSQQGVSYLNSIDDEIERLSQQIGIYETYIL